MSQTTSTAQAAAHAQVESLIKIQSNLVEQMAKFMSNTKKTAIARRTHGYYLARINGWHDLWQRFLSNESALSQIVTAEDSTKAYFKEEVFSNQEEIFYDFKGELVESAAKLEKAPASNNPSNLSSVSSISPDQRSAEKSLGQSNLPRISLPKFDGNYNEWISFRDLYQAVIHQNPHLENIQKFHYLKTSLTGEAANLIKHFSLTQANYESAWKSLTQRYENKRILVNSLLKTFTSQHKVSVESAPAVKSILDVTNECIISLGNLQIDTANWDPIIIHLVVQKLPADTHKEWEISIGDSTDLPTWAQLKAFLELRFRTLEAISGDKAKANSPNENKRGNSNNLSAQNFLTTQAACKICQGNHSVRSCPKFVKLEPIQRLRAAKSKGCCLNCLGNFHMANKCLSTARCAHCRGKHHTLLHSAMNKSHENMPPKSASSANPAYPNEQHDARSTPPSVSTLFLSERRQVLLATALVSVVTSEGLQIARALIDPGSQVTFVTHSLCCRLKLKMNNTFVKITGLANSEATSSRKKVSLHLKSRYDDQAVEADAVALDTLTDLLPAKALMRNSWEHLKDLPLADPNYHVPNRIDILIGADLYPYIMRDGLKIGPIGTPMGQNTMFGWILCGQIHLDAPNTSRIEAVSLVNTLELNFDLKKFWEIEEAATLITETAEDKLCEEIFRSTYRRKPDGSYIVRLPFKSTTDLQLGMSRNIALKRLLSSERTLKNKDMLSKYNKVLDEYLRSNQMEEVNPLETAGTDQVSNISSSGCRNNYLPHHAVIKEASSTTKLRIVFDASCKTSSGISLNQLLMTGPPLQKDLNMILFKWRFHKYVFSADIEKMYRRIWVHPDDTHYQRILWRPEENQLVKDYRLLTVTFGISCAPYLAIRTLQQLAEDENINAPEAARCLLNDFYVDDVLTGHDSIEKALDLRDGLISLLKKGNFHLRKFSSNNLEVLRHLPPEDVAKEPIALFKDDSTIKTLGISWNPKSDMFGYELQTNLSTDATKRNILSNIAKLFDPSGWLSPIIIAGKILIQKLWLLGIDWDAELPRSLAEEWSVFMSSLEAIRQIKVPRWLGYCPNTRVEYHGFCDSSERAYAAAIYIRVESPDGNISTHLLISKTRVAPIKTISLPRLELCGAHLLSKLVTQLRKFVGQNEQFYLWTDSTVVLCWINSFPNRWKSFVANRVSQIQENTTNCHWRHVPSEQNPADLASRGLPASELVANHLWWTGPHWLAEDRSQWPKVPADLDQTLARNDIKKAKTFQLKLDEEELAGRFSHFVRACRVIAYCLRFCNKRKNSEDERMHAYLTTNELKRAKMVLIRESQQHFYYRELEDLQHELPISRKSPILSLNPFLDDDGVLRVGGRLEHSSLSFGEKHPIILSRTSAVTSLLIRYLHEITLHGGPNLILATLRKNYWIPGVKDNIRKLVHNCTTCFRWKKETANQLMGNLPSARVTPERPFYATGIDFAGPINIKLSKVRKAKTSKAYIAIFVCFSTKAIHIELVSDLSSESFFAALRRFFARRGVSKEIYSDNGTNFIGAASILQKEINEAIRVNVKEAKEVFAIQNVNWHFIPPAAPHFGGLWEAGVKSIKHHLRRIVGQTLLTFEELNTVLVQIEAIVNSRPLSPLSEDPEDLTPLTPGHFLIGNAPISLPESNWDDAKLSPLSRWQHLQKLKNDFWKRWSTEYLSQLQSRQKWKAEQPSVNIGDLVLLKEENHPPSAWKLARITDVHKGSDDRVRVVTLRTSSTQLKRPITKICVLPYQVQN